MAVKLADIRKAAIVEPNPAIRENYAEDYAELAKVGVMQAKRAKKFLDQWRGEMNSRDIQQLEDAIAYARPDEGNTDDSIYEAMERLWSSGPMEVSAAAGKFLQGTPRARSNSATNPLRNALRSGLISVTMQRAGNQMRIVSETGNREMLIPASVYDGDQKTNGLRDYLSYKQQQAILNGEQIEARIDIPHGYKFSPVGKAIRPSMHKAMGGEPDKAEIEADIKAILADMDTMCAQVMNTIYGANANAYFKKKSSYPCAEAVVILAVERGLRNPQAPEIAGKIKGTQIF